MNMLDEPTDTTISSVSDQQLLQKNTGKWLQKFCQFSVIITK
jgi:hypothetical protein